MDEKTLATIIEASEEKRRELRAQIDETRAHFLKQENESAPRWQATPR